MKLLYDKRIVGVCGWNKEGEEIIVIHPDLRFEHWKWFGNVVIEHEKRHLKGEKLLDLKIQFNPKFILGLTLFYFFKPYLLFTVPYQKIKRGFL